MDRKQYGPKVQGAPIPLHSRALKEEEKLIAL